jgi:small-conductance mechanosensitive channel
MDKLAELLINPYIGIYLVLVAAVQVIAHLVARRNTHKIATRRALAGLGDRVIVNQSQRLGELKAAARNRALWLLLPVVMLPFLLAVVANVLRHDDPSKGLLFTFLLFTLWLLFTGTDLAKAVLGGLAFCTVTAISETFQVGDRVTLRGHSGKVTSIGIFYVKLQTLDDDLVSIPTASLWSENLVSANAGERASLCVMPFYLSPRINATQLRAAEDAIWAAIQGSTYMDPEKPIQIYLSQEKGCIKLSAKAYSASTYNEPLFKSDITHAFLQFARRENIPLAEPQQTELVSRA